MAKKISNSKTIRVAPSNTIALYDKYPLLILGFILFVTFLIYKKVSGFEITNFDDDQSILMNPYIQDMSIEGIKKMFTGYNLGMYAPIGLMFYGFLYSINGADAAIFHSASLFLHLCNIMLVFWTMNRLFKDNWRALAISAIFALHPLNTEAIAWISANTTLLSNGFLLSALLSYTYYKSHQKGIYLLLTLVLFLLAILVKSAAVTLTPLLLLIDYYFYKIDKKSLVEKIPFLVLTLFFGYMTFVSRSDDMMGIQLTGVKYSLFERMMMIANTIPFYLSKFLAPIDLCFNYPFPTDGSWPMIYYISLLLLPTIFIIIYFLGKKDKWIVFGFLFYLISISVMLPLFTVGNFELRYDRYNYLGIIGLALVMIELLLLIIKNIQKTLVLSMVLSLLLALVSFTRADAWANSMAIWDDGIKKNPDQCMAYFNKGVTAAAISGNEEALTYYKIAIEKDPKYFPAYINIGNIMFNRNNYAESYKYFKKAFYINSSNPEIAKSIVVCALKAQMLDSAYADGKKLTTLFPKYANGYGAFANVLNDMGKYEEALTVAQKGIRIDPKAYDCYFQKGFSEIKMTNYASAIESYNKAEIIKAGDPFLYYNRAFAYNLLQQIDKGCIDMKKAKDLGAPNCDPYLSTCL